MARYRRVARKPVVEAKVDTTDYESLLKSDLVALAESKGLDSTGTKADLIARLKS